MSKHENKTRVSLVMVYILFFVYAISTGILGTTLATILTDYSMKVSEGGIFTVVQYLGSATGIIISGKLLKNMSKWSILILTYLIFSLSLIAMFGAQWLAVFLIFLLIMGISTKIIDMVCNACIPLLVTHNNGAFLNLMHACFGIGNFIGPIYASRMLLTKCRWQLIFSLVGILAFLLMLILIFLQKNNLLTDLTPDQKGSLSIMETFRKPDILFLFIVLMFYSGHQGGVSNWAHMYLTNIYGVDTILAGYGVSAFWFGIILGRLICSALTTKFSSERILVTELCMACIFYGASIFSGNVYIAIGGFICAGLLSGATIPLCMSIGYTRYPKLSDSISVILFLGICSGQIIIPWVMGIMANNVGFKAAIIFNVCSLICALISAVIATRIKKN